MSIEQVSGFLFIALGAFMSGSFSIPFDKVRNWKWENYWLIYSLFAYVVVPLTACWILVPNVLRVYQAVSASTLGWIFSLGIIYGIANLTFGLSLRYLGVSLGYALSLGLMMAIGTIVPPVIDGRLSDLFENANGTLLLAGVLVSAIGIGISGYAGFLKDKQVGNAGNQDFHFGKGLLAAVFVGIVWSSQALGIEQGIPIAKKAGELGANVLFQDSPVFLVLYAGSFLATCSWCLYASYKNRSISNYVTSSNNSLFANYLFCALAGFLWYINYFFFGMGKNLMGPYTFTAWGILMTLTIVCATLWGLYRGEWKGASIPVYRLMFGGLATLIAASFMIGISGS